MRLMRSSGPIVFIILILLLAVLPLTIISTVAEPGLPILSVDIEPIGEVESDLMEIVVAQTTANISVSNFPLSALVHVTATTARWAVVVNPSSFEVAGGINYTETVSLNIMVTPHSPADTIVELQVVANTTTDLGVEYSGIAFTNISVKQYYGLRLSGPDTTALKPGNNVSQNLRIANMGNGVDDYNVTLRNRPDLTSKGLEVEFAENIHELAADRGVAVPILVTAANDTENGTVTAYFRVTSVGDPTRSDDYNLTITVGEENVRPVAIASILEDPDDLWTNMSILFSSNGSHDSEGNITFTWDWGDGTDPSTLANPTHVYEEPGDYNVTLTVTDQNNAVDHGTLTLTVQPNYGDTDISIKAVEPNTRGTFNDPDPDDPRQVAVMGGGWVAYLCDLRANQVMIVKITVFGDRPADLYLFEEVHFQTYKRNPEVTFVPFMGDGYKQGATAVFEYSFNASETDRYYIVIDNKDWPMGTETEGPVDYKISVDLTNPTPVAVASIQEDPNDLWQNIPINFSSVGSHDVEGEGRISFSWDWGDGTNPSFLANPVHAYEEPGTYTVTLTAHDKYDMIAQETIVLTVQRNYGDTEIIIKAPIREGRTYYDPTGEEIQQVAVKRDGWVAYLCDLRADEEMNVYIAIIGDHPADVYLFNEVNFQTYKNDPQATFVPFEEEGSEQGALGEVRYSFKVKDTDRYYIVIDNMDRPMGTETEGPVDYVISIEPVAELTVITDDPDHDLYIIKIAVATLAVLAVVFILDFFYKRSKE